MGGAGETELSGASMVEYGLGVTLQAITLPSPAAGCRLSKRKPEHSYNTYNPWQNRDPTEVPSLYSVCAVCLFIHCLYV